MSLFKEKKVVSGGNFEPVKLAELELGQSVAIFVKRFREGTSDEFGDYVSMQGLAVDIDESDENEFLNTAYLASAILNTMLQNMRNEGKLETGKLYRIEKAWDRGQKIGKTGKKAKGFGYNVFELEIAPSLASKLQRRFDELQNQDGDDSEVTEDDEVPTPKAKRPAL